MENKCKRFLSLLLALVMVIGLMPTGHVHAEENAINLVVGETRSITIDGDYSSLNGSGDEVVSVNAAFIPELTAHTVSNTTTDATLESGKYVLQNTRVSKFLEGTSEGGKLWLAARLITTAEIWTITKVDDGYTMKASNGQYLTFDGSSSGLTDTETVLSFTWKDTSTWQIGCGDQYLNSYDDEQKAAGWREDGDDGSQWKLYKVTDQPAYTWTLGDAVSQIEDGGYYIFENNAASSRAASLVSSKWSNTSNGGGGTGYGLLMEHNKTNFGEQDIWKITGTAGDYHVQNYLGWNLFIAGGKATLTPESQTTVIGQDSTSHAGKWQISVGGVHLNWWGGANGDGVQVAGWGGVDDVNSQWNIYEVIPTALGTTYVTVNALKAGTSEITIGDTTYTIHVTAEHVCHFEGVLILPATCTEEGLMAFECVCGERSHTEEIPATGHTPVTSGGQKPTLCEPGTTGTTSCGVCGEAIAESTEITQLPVGTVLHDNKMVALNDCEYTYNASNSSFTHTDANGTVYSVRPSSGVGVSQPALIPQTTVEVFSVSLIWGSGDFDGRVQISGNGSIHFHTDDSKPCWDKCGNGSGAHSDWTNHGLYLFIAGGDSTEFPGYTQVTSADDMVDGGKYLIAAKTDDAHGGNWYVMRPTAGTNEFMHVAQYTGVKDITGHTPGEAVRENEVPETCGDEGSYDMVVYCSVCNTELSRTTEGIPSTGNHTYDSDLDADCNVCGQEREVKAFTSQQITGLTGQGSSVDTSESGVDKSLENAFDGNLGTFWATVESGTLEEDYLIADLGGEYLINKVEYTKRHDSNAGYNCTGNLLDYIIEVSTDNGETWQKVASGATVDGTTEIVFTPVMASLVKLTATRSYHWQDENANKVMTAAEFAVYKAVCVEHAPAADSEVENEIPATCGKDGSYDIVRYCSICGAEVSRETTTVPATGEHTYDNDADADCNVCGDVREIDAFVTEKLTGITGDDSSTDTSEPAFDKSVGNAFDGDYSTFWATVPNGSLTDAYLIADLGGTHTVNKVEYTKRHDANAGYNCTGNLLDYIIEVSTDGKIWTKVAAGDTVDGTTIIEFAAVEAAYVRLTSTSSYHWQMGQSGQPDNRNTVMTVAELAVYSVTCNIHNEEIIPAKAPTCTDTGLTEGKKCSVCGEILEAQETVPTLAHTASVAVKEHEKAPTCTETGSYDSVVYCSVCGAQMSRETVTVEAEGHKPGEPVRENEVAPTLNSEGSYDEVVYCSVCSTELSRTPVTVPALDGAVAQVDGVKYATLTEAIEKAPVGGIVNMLDDVTEDIVIDKDIVLRMQSHTLYGQIKITAPISTILGGSSGANGKIVAEGKDAIVIGVKDQKNEEISVLVNSVDVTSNTDCALLIYDGSATVIGSSLTSTSTSYAAVQGSGRDFGNVELNNTTVTSEYEVAVYWPHAGTLTTNSSTITGATGLYIKQGTANLNGGTIKATGAQVAHTPNSNGGNSTGDAITVDKGATEPVVNLNANLISENGNLVGMYGGTFNMNRAALTAKKNGFRVEDGVLNLNYGSVEAGYSAVFIRGGEVNVYKDMSLRSNGNYAVIQGNGLAGGNVTIHGGVVESRNDMAIYWPGSGNLTIEGGTVEGTTAIYAKQGNVTISGGIIRAIGEKVDFSHVGNGANSTGDAVVLESCDYGTLTASITGGQFESRHGKAVAAYAQPGYTELSGFITGGQYQTEVDAGYLAEGYCAALAGEYYVVAPHEYASEVTAPTCTTDGYTTYTCSRCGHSYVDDNVTALGHTASVAVKVNPVAPDCTNEGSYDLVVSCSVCKAEISRQTVTIPALGHNYEAVVTAPTCATGGYTTHTCSRCDHSYVDAQTDAMGHSYGSVITAPTCTTDGYTTYTCSVCGDSYVADETSALGHSYENGFCTGCGGYEAPELNADGFYEIGNAGQLYWFAAQVNNGANNINAILTADIEDNENLMEKINIAEDGTATVNDGETIREWVPIGGSIYPYSGTFDGNGKTVTGLYRNVSANFVGLIGYLKGSGKVQNVTVADSYFRGGNNVGGVVGYSCTGSTVSNCHNTGSVSGSYDVGGVAGWSNDSTLSNCHNTGTVSGSYYVGGVAGWNADGTMSNCYNTGTVSGRYYVGGVVGSCDTGGTVSNCYNTGSVSGVFNTGGVVGVNSGTVTNCFYLDTCGAAGKGTAKTEAQFASGEVAWLLNGSTDEGELVWKQNIGTDAIPGFEGEIVSYSSKTGAYYNKGNHEHQYEAVVTEPTCTEPGYTTYTCSVCGHNYVDAQVDALGHTAGEAVIENQVAATCGEEGSYDSVVYCSVCGAQMSRETTTVPATGEHTYDGVFDADCNVCGGTREVPDFVTDKLTGITGEDSSTDTSEPEYDKSVGNAFDGDYNTFWATVPGGTLADAYLIADLGGTHTVNKVEYTKRHDANAGYNCTGNLLNYIIEVSTDGKIWTKVAAGDTVDGTTIIEFAAVEAAYVRLTSTSSYHWQMGQPGQPDNRNTVMTVAELAVYSVTCNIHNEEIIPAQAPTCTETGLTEGKKCSVCGEIITAQEVIPALGHKAAEAVRENEKDATCTADGSYDSVVYCSVCSAELSRKTVTIPALGHTEETVAGKDATCTETGLTEGKKCSVCGETTVAQETVPALGHTEETIPGKDATCTEAGLTEGKKCSVCDEITEAQEIVPALGHKDDDQNFECDVCGEDLCTDHTEEIIKGYAATCTEPGKTDGKKCSICGEILEVQVEIPALGHAYESEVTAPTCTTEGYTTHTCSRCDHSYVDAHVDALGHTASEATKENQVAPDCTNEGSYDLVVCCSVCNAEISRETVNLPALGHSYESEVTAPTCTTGGYTTHTCSRCDHSYVDAQVDALGHTAGEAEILDEVAATCTEDGYCVIVTHCTVCGVETSRETNTIEAPGHSYESEVTAPTCTTGGYTTHTCSRCDHSYVDARVDALGHTAADAVIENQVAATCGKDGSYDSVVYCSVCGAQMSRETTTVPATGEHTYDGVFDADCNVCGGTREVPDFVTDKLTGISGEGSSTDTSEPEYDKSVGNAFDGDYSTFWATVPDGTLADAYLIADLGGTHTVNKVEYTKRHDANAGYNCTGNLLDYIIEVSTDGKIWTKVAAGDTVDGTTIIEFAAVEAAYVRLTSTSSYHWQMGQSGQPDNRNTVMTVAELAVYSVTCNRHTEEILPAQAPTCTETGLTEGKKCSVCGETTVAQETIPALGHKAAEAVRENEVAATCSAEGSYDSVVYCSVCKAEISRETITVPTLAHTEETVPAKAPTCTETGLTEGKKCSVCGEIITAQEVIPALGHKSAEAVRENEKAATCSVEGSYDSVVYCSVCKAEISRETITVPALAHTEEILDAVAPTCTETGLTEGKKCSVCGEITDAQETIPALGHTEETIPGKDATCTETGLTEGKKCSVCGETTVAQETVPALGHTEETIPGKDATCTETGLTEGKKCSVCGETTVAQETFPALGHTEETIPGKDATCTETGLTEGKKCSVCGEIITAQEIVPALGHDFVDGECTRCDAVKPAEPVVNPFVDVSEDSFYYDSVLWAVKKHITNGVTETHFEPNGICNRAQAVTFLWRAAGSPKPISSENPFVDVNEGSFYYEAVLWAVEKGITNGVDDTHFAPNAECTRAQVVTFLWRAADKPAATVTNNFSDVADGMWYTAAIDWAVEQGIAKGLDDDTFGVADSCNRAQAVTLLYRRYAE